MNNNDWAPDVLPDFLAQSVAASVSSVVSPLSPTSLKQLSTISLSSRDPSTVKVEEESRKKKKKGLLSKLFAHRRDKVEEDDNNNPEVSSILSSAVLSTKTPIDSLCSSDLSRDAQQILGGFRKQRESRESKKRQEIKKHAEKAAGQPSEEDFLGSLLVFPNADTAKESSLRKQKQHQQRDLSHRSKSTADSAGKDELKAPKALRTKSANHEKLDATQLVTHEFPRRRNDKNGSHTEFLSPLKSQHEATAPTKKSYKAPGPLISRRFDTLEEETFRSIGHTPLTHKRDCLDTGKKRDQELLISLGSPTGVELLVDQETVADTDDCWGASIKAVGGEVESWNYGNSDSSRERLLPRPPFFQTSPEDEEFFHQPDIAISPGVTLPLRGVDETVWYAKRRAIAVTSCWSCNATLRCIDNAEFVLCPVCRVIAPLEDDNSTINTCQRRGVAMGLAQQEWWLWKEQHSLNY